MLFKGQIIRGEFKMTSNKISDRLSKILNKEITEVELHIPSFTEDKNFSSSTSKEEIKQADSSSITAPVSIDGYIPVIIIFRTAADINSQNVKSILSGAKIKYEYSIIPAIAAHVTENQIVQLSQLAQVTSISFDDYMVSGLDTARKWFGVDKAVKTYGVTGNSGNPRTFTKMDNVIAILDTGIDIKHLDLGSGKVIGWHDEINSLPTPYDDNGHGTHVASIAGGLGKAIWDYRGVAYGAALVGVKVLNANNYGTYSQIIAGIQWCINNKSTYGIRVINMSIFGPSDAAVRAAVTAAITSGIVFVCIAGNDGPAANTIGSPGDTHAAITVGAMADVGHGGYYLARFSSRGPTFDGSIKPDLVAPGVDITAAKAGTVDQYITMSGTSMASPFVAGVVALMLDANGSLTPAQIKQILIETAELWGSPDPNNDYGHGRLRAFEALTKVCRMYGSKCFRDCHCPPNPNPCCPINYGYPSNPCPPPPPKDTPLDTFNKYMHPEYPNHFSASGTIVAPNRNDWYEFYVTRLGYPAAVNLIITSPVPATDIDLYVYNPLNVVVGSSISVTRQDTVSFIPTAFGKYIIKVLRYSGTPATYQLDLSVFGGNFNWWQTSQ